MLNQADNELICRVGPGTPMGNVMRRYWHPIAATSELEREQVLAVRVLGENLVLYRSRRGEYGVTPARSAETTA